MTDVHIEFKHIDMKKILVLLVLWLTVNFALLINSTDSLLENKDLLVVFTDTTKTYRYDIKRVGTDVAIKDRWTSNCISEFFLVNTLKIYYKSFSEHDANDVYVNDDNLVIIDL